MFEKRKNTVIKKISLFDAFIGYISIVSLLNVFLLTINFFYPLLSLLIGFLLTILVIILFRVRITLKHPQFHLLLLIIIIIGLFFRLAPNLYLTGGQDQGTYASLSKQYEINHGLYIKDDLRELLSDEPKRLYDKGNVFLGLELKDIEDSSYIMPFYPVFPSWLSIFSTLLGSDNRVYALTFFGLLSIVGSYLFSYQISNKKKEVALLSSFLIAINPLHVYFSRTPLTEVVSLTFFFLTFYYLMRFYDIYKGKKFPIIPFLMSLLTANVLFYTRMNALLYIPIILLIPVVTLLFAKLKELNKYLSIYSLLWLSGLAVSYLYYFLFIPELFYSIINGRLLKIPHFELISIILILLLIGLFSSLRIKRISNYLSHLIKLFNKYIYFLILVLFFGLIAFQIYGYIKEIIIDNRFSFSSFDSLSYLKQLSILTTFLYLSPIGFLLVPISIYYLGKSSQVKITLLILFSSIFIIYCWGILTTTQYHYYFARYQLSELIPLLIVIISNWLVSIRKGKVGNFLVILFLLFSTLYFGYFSLIQLRDHEGAKSESFVEIKNIVKENDILLVPKTEFIPFNQIVFPLKYYYQVNIFPLYSLSYTQKDEIRSFREQYDNVYVLSTIDSLSSESFKLVKEIDFNNNYLVHCNRDNDMFFKMESHSPDLPLCKYIAIPNRFYYGKVTLYLYRWVINYSNSN